ncbi:SLAM family member 9-like [Ahaetulla prasina]|uniref:SLAM family member 9-like n=1 Tax=Ahaetulla prasina TaxID=499056 RepID=UPI0026470ED8|nr:SLAM family member 9-like [Ahaetulla prasina]
MSHKSIVGLWLSLVLLGAGASETKELYGILGGSVTFRLTEPPPYEKIRWSKGIYGNSIRISAVNDGEDGEPCGLQGFLTVFEEELRVSEDCRELHLSHLQEEDAGRYTAHIVQQNRISKEFFDLEVLKQFPESEIRVTCTSMGAGKGVWQLNCSTGTLKDEMEFRWNASYKGIDIISEGSVVELNSQDLDLEFTCMAKTEDSVAFRTVTLKEVCSGQTKNLPGLPLWALLCLSLGGSLLLPGCMELIPMEKSRKADGGGRSRAHPSLETTDRCLR